MQLPLDSRRRLKDLEEFGCFFGERQGSGKLSFVGYFVSLSAFKLPSGQKVKSSELQEDLPAMCTQDIYEEDAELDCDLPAFWF